MPIRSKLKALPKVELHLHLEGAIPLAALWELISKYGRPPDVAGLDDLARRFAYRDFPHFLDTWSWKNGFLREYEDFTFIASAVAADLADQNIVYAEAFYSSKSDHSVQPRKRIPLMVSTAQSSTRTPTEAPRLSSSSVSFGIAWP